MSQPTEAPALGPHRFRVRYYDRRMSRRGQGVQSRLFRELDEAQAFAANNQLYSRPCRVESLEEIDST